MDLYSRRIVGWSVGRSNDADLTCRALRNAVGTRGDLRREIIHHSDRGSTYASDQYQGLLMEKKMKSSMSAKGNCYDNAAMESFYGRYKTSTVRDHIFKNEDEVRANVFEYIEVFYNRYRKHSALGYKCPMDFEEKFLSPMGDKVKASCFQNN